MRRSEQGLEASYFYGLLLFCVTECPGPQLMNVFSRRPICHKSCASASSRPTSAWQH